MKKTRYSEAQIIALLTKKGGFTDQDNFTAAEPSVYLNKPRFPTIPFKPHIQVIEYVVNTV